MEERIEKTIKNLEKNQMEPSVQQNQLSLYKRRKAIAGELS